MSVKLGKRYVDSALIASYIGAAVSAYKLELHYVLAGSLVVLASMILVFNYTCKRSISEAKTLTYLSATSIMLGGFTGVLLNGFSNLSSILYAAGLSLLALVYSVMASWRSRA